MKPEEYWKADLKDCLESLDQISGDARFHGNELASDYIDKAIKDLTYFTIRIDQQIHKSKPTAQHPEA